jgi:hypothetical protein
MRATITAALLFLVAWPLAAQGVKVDAGVALGEYREQAAALRFRGWGPTATLSADYRRFGATITATRLALTHAGGDATPSEPFDLTQLDMRFRVRVARRLGAEAGFLHRSIAPDRAAQGVGVVRVGTYASYPLAPGADLALRASYLGAAHFSGGGSAPFGVELGLGVSYGPGSGRFRAISEFELQRLDRQTSVAGEKIAVPIQSTVARIGGEIRF